jgi:hypothetical protein
VKGIQVKLGYLTNQKFNDKPKKNKSPKKLNIMKHLIAITFMVILSISLNAQLPKTGSIPGFRSNPNSSKHFKPQISLKSVYASNKPTLDSCVYKVINTSTGTWENGLKQEFKYNQSGIPSLSSSYYWDTESDKWIPLDKDEVSFNTIGNLILEIYYEYSDGQYYPKNREEIIYSIDGLIEEKLISKYVSGVLDIQDRSVYEYDGNGYIKSISHYSRSAINLPWTYKMKYKYTVDNMGRITEELLNDSDVNNDGIINFMDWIKTTFSYSTEGNMTSSKINAWDNGINGWYVHSKADYTYNSESQILTEKHYFLNNESNEFEMRWDDEWIYDSNGNNTVFIFRDLDESSGEWSMEKTEYTYDLLASASDFRLPYDFGLACVNKPVSIKNFDEFTNPDWRLLFSGTYYYSDKILTNVKDLLDPGVTCLQQLRNFTFTWEGTDEFLIFDVYNLAGQIVYSKRIKSNQITTLENLSNGLYLYRLSNIKKAFTGKFLLK